MVRRVFKGWSICTSLFLLSLVLSLPFQAAIAFAEITSVEIHGQDHAEGAVRSVDDSVEVIAHLDEEVQASQMVLAFGPLGVHPFTSCSGFDCFFSFAEGDRTPREVEYTVKHIEETLVQDAYNGILVIDGEAPTIEDFSLEKEGRDLTLSYDVRDTACPGCQSCAGVQKLLITQNGNEVDVVERSRACSYSGELETSIDELNLAPGEGELCIIAEDAVGQQSDPACSFLIVDRDEPYFVSDSLKIVRIGTTDEIHYTKGLPIPVDVFITVQDVDLDLNSVRADLSGLNTIAGEGYKDLPGTCTPDWESEEEGTYTCRWQDIIVDVATESVVDDAVNGIPGSAAFQFSAKDSSGNKGVYTVVYPIIEDKTAPRVVTVTRVLEAEGEESSPFDFSSEEVFLKQGQNTLAVVLDATGSGFAHKRVYLSLGALGATHQQAESCEESSSQWKCLFTLSVPANAPLHTQLQITSDSRDDAGNALGEFSTHDVTLDTRAPEIGEVRESTPCPTSQDTLVVTIEAKENTDRLGVYAQPATLLSMQERFSTECVAAEEGVFACDLTLSNFVSYAEQETVDFVLVDAAGNTATTSVTINVCETSDLAEVDFLQVYPGTITSVDKRTLSAMDYPVFVPLTIQRRVSGAEILGQTVACEGASSAYFVGEGMNSDLIVKVSKQSFDDAEGDGGTENSEGDEGAASDEHDETDEITVLCTLQFTMKRGTKVFTTSEVEVVTLVVPLYGTSLGSTTQAITDKLTALTTEIDQAEKQINTAVKWNTIFGFLCNLARTLGRLNAVIGAVKTVFYALGLVGAKLKDSNLPYTTQIGQVLTKLWTGFCNAGSIIDVIITKGIWPPGITFGINGIPLIKYACILHSGKLCDSFDGFMTGWGYVPRNERYGYDAETGALTGDLQQWPMYWDPYRSVYTANSCLFLSARIYNLRKARQLSCMRRTCIEENARVGLPLDTCEVMYKERTCLYVESAQWKAIMGGHPERQMFNFIFNVFILKLDWWIASIIYKTTNCPNILTDFQQGGSDEYCDEDRINTEAAAQIALCHVFAAALTIQETGGIQGFIDNWGLKTFKAELPGTDYCT